MPFTLKNIREEVEDIGTLFDGPRALEFRAATKALELEESGLTYQRVPPAYRFPTATRTRRRRSTWSCAGAGG